MNWDQHVSVDPHCCHGQACIAGTRIMGTVVLLSLAAGSTVEEIGQSYPSTSADAANAILHDAADLARERMAPLDA